jgi:hypothetical protein
MITLGSRSFAGPFMAPLWSPPRAAGLYAVMAPGWRLLTFRALEFDHAADLSTQDLLKNHPKYREWLTIVGTQWNLYIATHEMALSTPSERSAALRELARGYRPEFKALALPGTETDLKTLLLARALRSSDDKP